jgi:hypothetical protein
MSRSAEDTKLAPYAKSRGRNICDFRLLLIRSNSHTRRSILSLKNRQQLANLETIDILDQKYNS